MTSEIFFSYLGLASLIANISLTFAIFIKIQQIAQLNKTVAYLKQSLEEMDEQAKMIVRTDLELNKTQEELDKRIDGLYALQRLSQNLSKTLDAREIFNYLNQDFTREIGFQKALVFLEDAHKKISLTHQTGYFEKSLEQIKNKAGIEELYSIVKRKGSALSSISQEPRFLQIANSLLELDSFVISPITKKEGICGIILLGNDSHETTLTEGDEELVSILATQIGQALDNAELFETVYLQHQELEKKVVERTKELSKALDELKIVSKRKTEFVSAVSHELRTPLTSIKGYASILLTEKLGKVPTEVKERLVKINQHSDELTHMVNDLLDIARIESGRFEMKPEPLVIRDIAEAIIDLLSPQLKDKAINVLLDLPASLAKVLADKTQLSRVFINLMGNAIKFVPPNTGTIRISASESDELMQINISDNGIGMNPQDATRIFEEFYRVDNPINQTVKGTGLGLTLVKNIIQAHNGKIWVESRLSQGSTFSFTLPKAI